MIRTLTLENFRNYERADLCFDPAVNLIVGENAQGKTNLLEAAAALSTIKLFRTAQKKEGLRFGCDHGLIRGSFDTEGMEVELELRLHRDRAMELYKNGIRLRRQGEARGLLRTVLFCPDDLFLVRAGAAARRKFLDAALCQLRPQYASALAEYERVLAHKLRILKDSEEKPALLDLLDDFTLRLCRLGALIIRYRAYYIRKLAGRAQTLHAEAAPHETLECVYHTVSSVSDPYASPAVIEAQLQTHAMNHRAAEIAAKSCLSGPHKDDLILNLGGVSAASFASQGQARTAALALKLAERELFFDEDNVYPVLLLDDVLSELDRSRQNFVLNHLGQGQVIITCCEEETAARFHAGTVFHVEKGTVRG